MQKHQQITKTSKCNQNTNCSKLIPYMKNRSPVHIPQQINDRNKYKVSVGW